MLHPVGRWSFLVMAWWIVKSMGKEILFALVLCFISIPIAPNLAKQILPEILLPVLGISVSVFTAFRNTQAYNRWWEARTLWGGLVNGSRNWRNARRFSRPAGSGCKRTDNRCRSSTVTGHVARPVCWRRYRRCCRARHLPAPPSVNPALHTWPPQPPIQSTCDQHAVTC